MYDVLQFLHVSFAVVWVGSGVGLLALMAAMARAGDGGTVMAVSRHMEGLGPRLFGPAAMGTLLFGIGAVMVNDGYGFTDTWIVIGLVGVAISLAITAVSNPLNRKLVAAIEARGPDDPEARGTMARTRMLNYANLVVLFVVIWAMVVKPGTG